MSKKKDIDSDLAGSEVALRRAAKKARKIAAQTGTPLVTYSNGKVRKQMIARETVD